MSSDNGTTTRPTPSDLFSERNLIGAAMFNPAALDALARVSSDRFVDPHHKEVAQAIERLVRKGHPIDTATVASELGARLGQLGGVPFLTGLQAEAGPTSKVEGYADRILDASYRAELVRIGDRLRNVGYTGVDPGTVLADLDDLRRAADHSTPVGASWLQVDLGGLRKDELGDQAPGTIFARSDDVGLVYAGKVHSFNGESESGKSWAACYACLGELRQGHNVAYLDFEDDAATVVSRMLAIGATWDELEAHFDYRRPEEALPPAAVDSITSRSPTLVVVDGVTEAMGVHGLDPDKNRDSAKFMNLLIRPLSLTGAAVVQVDHVTKNPENRGRYAIGAQHKRAAITGAMYTFTVTKPFGRGMAGVITINVEKDKPGHVRRAATGKKAAELHLTSNPEGTIVTAELRPPGTTTDTPFRPTVLMERVSRRLEEAGEAGLAKNGIKATVKGNKDHLGTAADVLAAEGYVTVHQQGQTHLHVSVKPYRRADDPLDPDHEEPDQP